MSVKLIQGDDLQFKILVKLSGECYDLSNVTGATLKIPTDTGTLDLTLGAGLTIPTPLNGQVIVDIDDSQSGDICTGSINIELTLDESGKIKTLQFKDAMEVSERLY